MALLPPPRGTKPVWSREIFHALVYRLGDYTIGIRASHLNGASLEELLKVAASTSAAPDRQATFALPSRPTTASR